MSLVIVLLLICSKNYAQHLNDSVSSTGGVLKSDTTVTINIGYIRLANVKMIERSHLLRITNEQDSIIIMKDKYINEQQKVITDFQKRVNDTNKLNESIKKDLDKQKKRNKIITYGAGGIILGLIIGLIAK